MDNRLAERGVDIRTKDRGRPEVVLAGGRKAATENGCRRQASSMDFTLLGGDGAPLDFVCAQEDGRSRPAKSKELPPASVCRSDINTEGL